ncbi:RCC1 domain-containing protein [Cellulosimicrobium cellulans]|uniref:RCC1 domain-containing protein n=1 Tax=Cellulosimicrobium cellulans TaxID=1710 RepID=UPI0016524F7F|nr:hypothetical protein [Cellulosimicrobium cellulans]
MRIEVAEPGWTHVAAGGELSAGIDEQGRVSTWGWSDVGGHGDGDGSDRDVLEPVAVEAAGVLAGKAITQVDVGDHRMLALDEEGRVYAWGYGYGGGLGNGSVVDSAVPVAVDTTGVLAGKTVTQVAAGWHSLALDDRGRVYAWGDGGASAGGGGSLGNGSTSSSSVPVAVDTTGVLAGKTITQVAAGGLHSLALDEDGAVYAWGGFRAGGALGDGAGTNSAVPVAVDTTGVLAGKTVTQVAAGYHYSLALDEDGQIYAWGDGAYGWVADSPVPVAIDLSGVPSGKTITSIAAGGHHALALDQDGSVYAWGWGRNAGALGNGTVADSLSPLAVDATGVLEGVTITQITAGEGHSVARDEDGKLYAWGRGQEGALGNGTTTDSAVPVDGPRVDVTESVFFGPVEATSVSRTSPAILEAVTPAHPSGVVDVRVLADGAERHVLPSGFTFGAAPGVTHQPAGGSHAPGAAVVLTAAANGDEAPSVVWQSQRGGQSWETLNAGVSSVHAAGATTTRLAVNAPDAGQRVLYRAVFSNGLGDATTHEATITGAVTSNPGAPQGGGTTGMPVDAGDPGLDAAAASDGQTRLATTGAQPLALIIAALALILAGAVVVVRKRLSAGRARDQGGRL